MDYVLAFGLFLLLALAAYGVVRLIVPPMKKLWGSLVLFAVSLGCLVFLLGLLNVGDLSYSFDGAVETLRAVWDAFYQWVSTVTWEEFVQDVKEAPFEAVVLLLMVVINILTAGGAGIAFFLGMSHEEQWWAFPAGLGTVVGMWLGLLVFEFIVILAIGLVLSIIKLFSAPEELGSAIGVILFILCIFGAGGGATYVITVRKE